MISTVSAEEDEQRSAGVDRLLRGDGSEVPLSLRVIRLFEKDSVIVCPPLRGRGNQVPALNFPTWDLKRP